LAKQVNKCSRGHLATENGLNSFLAVLLLFVSRCYALKFLQETLLHLLYTYISSVPQILNSSCKFYHEA